MEFDVMTRATTWDHVATLARRTEAAGFSGMLFTEGHRAVDGLTERQLSGRRPRGKRPEADISVRPRRSSEPLHTCMFSPSRGNIDVSRRGSGVWRFTCPRLAGPKLSTPDRSTP
jgi:hypothetical protein